MEVDEEMIAGIGDAQEGKRTKWAFPPSHQLLVEEEDGRSSNSHKGSVKRNSGPKGKEEEEASVSMIVPEVPSGNSLSEIAESLSSPKLSRLNVVARAEICPKIRRARLMSTKGISAKIREQYGYEISHTTFLYAEEAMYLLELGKLEISTGRVALSAERARSLLLHSRNHPYPDLNPTKVKSCSLDEYLVYKHLSELGYRVKRRDSDVKIKAAQPCSFSPRSSVDESNGHVGDSKSCNTEAVTATNGSSGVIVCDMGADDEGCKMDVDVEMDQAPTNDLDEAQATACSGTDIGSGIQMVPEFEAVRGTKRKFGELSSDQTPASTSSSAKDMSDEDADEELDCSIATENIVDMNGEAGFFQPVSSYTVTEADSDVEFGEEPIAGPSCRNGVYIEELGIGYDGDVEEDIGGCSQEPQPSTSSACFANNLQTESFVDLAESDPETEENVHSFSKGWSNKFVPNSIVQLGFPPQALLPNNIAARDTIYEFDLKSRESVRSESDLEYFVDELNLNSDPEDSKSKKGRRNNCKSWKEWRQGAVIEANDVLGSSLMGQASYCVPDNPMHQLHLWGAGDKEPEVKRKADPGWKGFNIPYEIYNPASGFTKSKNKKEILPSYVVAVVRNDDEVPSFATCDPLVNDVPVLIAIVSDESSIMFVNPDGSPIPSLF